MFYLGISALYHDSAAAIADENGNVIAAAQEERFSRKKQDNSMPFQAIDYCLSAARTSMSRIEKVVYYDDPLLTLNRVAASAQITQPETSFSEESLRRMMEVRIWVHEQLRRRYGLLGKSDTLFVSKHHLSHAASAYYPSPFREAAILTIDGVGEWNTTTVGFGRDSDIQILNQIDYPHSFGLLYSAFTGFCGFRVNSGEYKLMGLAPYGKPTYYDLILKELIDIKQDGSFRLNLDYFSFPYDYRMVTDKFLALFGGPPRKPGEIITEREANMAASIQKVTNEILLRMARYAKKLTGTDNLVLAGGTALNCTANGELIRAGVFDNVWIQPAAGDAGGALGCAMLASAMDNCWKAEGTCQGDRMRAGFLGPSFSNDEIEEALCSLNVRYKRFNEQEHCDEIARLIASGKVVGWFQGRMEYGPRALGARSILGDPRNEKMQAKLNLKIKNRESFRPFAPAVIEEDANQYFDMKCDSPYMLATFPVREDRRKEPASQSSSNVIDIVNQIRSDIPAVTHVDHSARVQTVNERDNPLFYRLLSSFKRITGCSCVINTSFNVRGEPIVCTPADALRCFFATDMDALSIGDFCVLKEAQDMAVRNRNWRVEYEPD